MSVTVVVNWNGTNLSLAGADVHDADDKITTKGSGITYEPGKRLKSVDKFVVRFSDPVDAKLCVVTDPTTLVVENPNVEVKTRWDYTLYATTTGGNAVRLDPIWEDDP